MSGIQHREVAGFREVRLDHLPCSFEQLVHEFCGGQSAWRGFQSAEQVERRLAHLHCAFDTGSRLVTTTNLKEDLR